MSVFVLALDQGTTSSRALLFDRDGAVVAEDQYEFPQYFPEPGWVEHNPLEIWGSQLRAARGVLEKTGTSAREIAAVGITNQRETAVVWERDTWGADPSRDRLAISPDRHGVCDRICENGWARRGNSSADGAPDRRLLFRPRRSASFSIRRSRVPSTRAEAGELCFGTSRYLADLQAHEGVACLRDGAFECFADACSTIFTPGHWDNELPARCIGGIPARDAPRSPRLVAGSLAKVDPEWFGAGDSRSPVSQGTNRLPLCSGRVVSSQGMREEYLWHWLLPA